MAATVLKYPGSKWNLAARLVASLPPHEVYLEPFFGSGAVFFTKAPSRLETINDLDGNVVNLFQVLRDDGPALARGLALTPWAREEYEASYAEASGDPVEDARRFVVRCWQAFGARTGARVGWRNETRGALGVTTAQTWATLPERAATLTRRLRGVQIENQPALEIIGRYAHPNVLIYADPPYQTETRLGRLYQHEMTDDDHRALLDALDAHPGPVVLSGYACPLYDDRLGHWQREEIAATAEGGRARTEIVWRNARAARPRLAGM